MVSPSWRQACFASLWLANLTESHEKEGSSQLDNLLKGVKASVSSYTAQTARQHGARKSVPGKEVQLLTQGAIEVFWRGVVVERQPAGRFKPVIIFPKAAAVFQ